MKKETFGTSERRKSERKKVYYYEMKVEMQNIETLNGYREVDTAN